MGTGYAHGLSCPDLDAWTAVPTATFLKNTAIVTFGALVGELLSSSLVAYGFARLRFPGRDALFMLCLSSLMLPSVVLLIPLFIMFRTVHWIDTYLPLVVPGAGLQPEDLAFV